MIKGAVFIWGITIGVVAPKLESPIVSGIFKPVAFLRFSPPAKTLFCFSKLDVNFSAAIAASFCCLLNFSSSAAAILAALASSAIASTWSFICKLTNFE